jgi:hypothetical protein
VLKVFALVAVRKWKIRGECHDRGSREKPAYTGEGQKHQIDLSIQADSYAIFYFIDAGDLPNPLTWEHHRKLS